jgi:RHS repeat-associated protein
MLGRKIAGPGRAFAAACLGVALAWAMHVAPAAAQTCAPGTCCATNPTTGTPACGAAAGNPLNVMSGNKFQREVDMPALPGVLGLELVRYYNSEAALADERGILGRGWRLSYEAELAFAPGGERITVHQGDGTQTRYEKAMVQFERGVTVYDTNEPGQSSLRAQRVAGTLEYSLTLANGNRQTFDAQGKLARIAAPTGECVTLQRDVAGFLLRVTDPQGRFLSLRHLSPQEVRTTSKFRGVQFIDSPVGRFAYTYGSAMPAGSTEKADALIANLVKVALPTRYDPNTKANPLGASGDRGTTTSTVSRIYHYEDAKHPTLLTGITVQGQGSDARPMNERIVTWGYDARGRANLSVKGAYDPKKPGLEQVTLEFHTKASDGSGTTVLTNSLGQTTTYSYAQINGKPQLLEVRGAGCATCGPANVRHRYDQRGRLMEDIELDAKGQPVTGEVMQYDGVDRLIRVSAVRYKSGKAGAARIQVRYQYGPDPLNQLPTVIARPSVVVGREHLIRITYNNFGQATEVAESGFEPIDKQPIERAMHFDYAVINGRSVLKQIDGPLPNGPANSPADSDITRIDWDPRGNFVTTIEEPGARVSRIDHSETGRVARVRNGQGAETRFDYETLGALERISTVSQGWNSAKVEQFKHDALGRLTETGRQVGDGVGYRARFAQSFDVADRLLWRASHLGMLEQHRYDTESRVVQSGRYSSSIAQAVDYDFDNQGRLSGMRDSSGAAYRFKYTGDTNLVSVEDAFGDLWRKPSAADAAKVRASKPLRLVDDFGRVVAVISPDTGRTVRSYDSADRMVSNQDALGNQARYEYDLQSRILRQTITDSRTKHIVQTQWRYSGAQIVGLDDSRQSERYTYDERGLRIGKTVTLHTPKDERSSTTHYDYDAHGELQATSLPDGSRITYERNGQGQVVALYRDRIQTSWLRWALPRQLIVKNLQRDIEGINRYVTGNGIEVHMQRSRSGALARIVYRNLREPKLLSAEYLPGMGSANASTLTTASSASDPNASKLPGATGLPHDPQALIDHRYLWDTRGDLLLRQDSTQQGLRAEGYAYDKRARLIASVSEREVNRYAYDSIGRRVLAQQGAKNQAQMEGTVRIGHAKEAGYRLTAIDNGTQRIQTEYDVTGLPRRTGKRSYAWDALGRLLRIDEDGKVLASYSYNHRGERIGKSSPSGTTAYLYDEKALTAELNDKGLVTREYIYLADTPVAAIDAPAGVPLADDDSWSALLKDLRNITASVLDADTALVWLHTNHLGAPEAATNSRGQLVWQASYAPFGQVSVKSDNFTLNIRMPGQYEDAESGLYYNRQRYYDPSRGQYISPDPLGTPNGPDGYAYVNYNPLKYVDPDGLVLFAFDGTNNTDDQAWLAANNSSLSNVALFKEAYLDGDKRYVTGVGTDHANRDNYGDIIAANYSGLGGIIPDKGGNYSGPARIDRMLLYFAEEANAAADDEAMEVDIIGFSRGAAEARDFANRIASNTTNGWYSYKYDTGKIDPSTLLPVYEKRCQKVDFRFIGLWDTVLSTNKSGTPYNLGIPAQFSYVAQAVALNEYRSAPAGTDAFVTAPVNFRLWDNTRVHLPDDDHYGGFPLESIGTSDYTTGHVRLERGFIGAHADIGGGYGDNNGLSTVALSWMVAQAQLAGVSMNSADIRIDMNNPVIHDQSNALRVGNPLTTSTFQAPGALFGTNTYTVEDREVHGGLGTGTERGQTFGPAGPDGSSSMTNADTHQFINYTPRDTAGDTRKTNNIPEIQDLHNQTGAVDMTSYINWLRLHGYTFAGDK